MEWLYLLMPIAGVKVFWPGLVVLGFGVGIIGSFFGMGGGWMVTPGLNILGFPMAFAIGTDITQMAGNSMISTMRHAKFGNVDYKLGAVMTAGTVAGFEAGAQSIMWLERIGKVDGTVRSIYLLLLAAIAWTVLVDVSRKLSRERKSLAPGRMAGETASGIQWHGALQKIRIPPMIHFERAGVCCSAWLPVAVSFITGYLSGLLGIGGGLVRTPALIYLVGVPTHVAIGTDLFEIVISALYGCATYTYKGRTDLVAALIMLGGASVGAQIGSVATKYVKGYGIRLMFGIAVAGCALSVGLKLAASGTLGAAGRWFNFAAAVLILGLVAGMSLIILMRFVRGVREELALVNRGGHHPG
jgi:uncharacterized protein